jgi:hypothetical protein
VNGEDAAPGEPGTGGTEEGGRRRRIVVGVLAAIGILAVAGVLLATLAAQNTSGTPALREAQARAAAGLADLEAVIGDQGGTLQVTWTSTPAPAGDGHLVVARLKVLPSGEVSEAQFVVDGTEVGGQNALANRILEVGAGT